MKLPVHAAAGLRLALCVGAGLACAAGADAHYPIVGSGQDQCFSERGAIIDCPIAGRPLRGQDAQHPGNRPRYRDNGDGTVSDPVTGLVWAKAASAPLAFAEIEPYARKSRLGGHDDWRVPNIRELYSLIDYRGGYSGDPATSRPYMDLSAFDFAYAPGTGLGDAAQRRRPIDVQEWSATRYVGRTMGRDDTVFGVNFADGRIKGYPMMDPMNRMRSLNRLAVRLVRGPPYGQNDFEARRESVMDRATRLEWQRREDGSARSWGDALAYCSALSREGGSEWRLPTAKELHSIVDYTRIPAIDPLFEISDPRIYLWSSTTHLEGPPPATEPNRAFSRTGELAVYAAIGPAMGFMEIPPGSGQRRWVDVHGAGAMRSDPKTATPGAFPNGFGPQGDDIRGHNHVLCVRDWKP
ncbi:MAG: DUF1566 domain-containing protein [Methylobacterium sp.]|nr:DUF1566 domain-containing protein [Methylobacterium sp.]MCA3603607.1 DUF1566 domain-containing protein [Methylobacterium sp.]MCA3614431.1 DUF1566 domain-containing protein [Methylobacterium sp.]